MAVRAIGEADARPLRLIAFDADDLGVISAHVQDALVRFGDMAYLPRAKRFALVADRFDWCAAGSGQWERCRIGLHLDHVTAASFRDLANPSPQALLNLLSIVFDPTDAPGGFVYLHFSGGGSVRLTVDCLEAQMRDIGPRWPTRLKPGHPLDDATETP